MNKPIRTMAILCMVLFMALMVNATYLQYVRADELADDPRNRRVVVSAFSRERGAILVEREPVAKSVPSNDKYEYQRTYPEPFKYAHTTGYFSYYNATAIERSQNAILSGEDSRLFVTRLVDLLGNSEPQGGSVLLTLDRAAQNAAVAGLDALPGDQTQAAVIALEPSSGKVLAMASSPSFNPNKLATHNLDKALKAYQRLESAESEPLLNRAIQTTLPPGSTFKLVTAAAALESGNYENSESLVPSGFSFDLPQSDTVIRNHDGSNCGGKRITFTRALAVSCNVTFLTLADELGTEKMLEQAEAFGFNSNDYLDALRVATSDYPEDLNAPQTAMSGIGQSSVTASPLQMAMVVAGIANSGVVMEPYIVDEVRTPDLDVLEKTEPTEMSQAVSASTARELTEMMVATVESGTATPAQIPGIAVAGKTGTAQSTEERPPYAWFVSFAPANNPQVAVAVLVESADVARSEIAGGRLGGPIAKAVMEAVINGG